MHTHVAKGQAHQKRWIGVWCAEKKIGEVLELALLELALLFFHKHGRSISASEDFLLDWRGAIYWRGAPEFSLGTSSGDAARPGPSALENTGFLNLVDCCFRSFILILQKGLK